MTVTIKYLQDLAEATLRFGVECLMEKGSLDQMFFLVEEGGCSELIICDDSVTNSERRKQEFAEMLRERVEREKIAAVLMVSDAFLGSMTAEEDRIRRMSGMTVLDCINAGLIPPHEGAIVTLESPDYQQVSTQEYRRLDGKRQIELVGEPTITRSTEDSGYAGRFMTFYPRKQAGRA